MDGSYAPHGTNASPLPPSKKLMSFLDPLKMLFKYVPVLFCLLFCQPEVVMNFFLRNMLFIEQKVTEFHENNKLIELSVWCIAYITSGVKKQLSAPTPLFCPCFFLTVQQSL
jgi:hypothetical protein